MAEPKQRLVAGADWLTSLVAGLRGKQQRVLAPVQRGEAVEFLPVDSADAICATYINTRIPLKAVLFPRTEVLLRYRREEGTAVDFEAEPPDETPTTVIGARPNALTRLPENTQIPRPGTHLGLAPNDSDS